MVDSGVEAALVLGNKKRQSVFKQNLNKKFPWIPPGVLDTCMDALSASFENVAPSDLKKALQPGGLEKVRPGLESKIVKSLKTQDMIMDIPLKDDDKTKLLEYIVKLSLDYLLEDAQAALQAPSLQLQTLEREQSEIRRYMSVWQITWYRFRYFPLRSIGLALLVAWSGFLTYQFYKETVIVSSIASIMAHVCATVGVLAYKVVALVATVVFTLKRQLRL